MTLINWAAIGEAVAIVVLLAWIALLLDRLDIEKQEHHLTRAALRYWRKYSVMPAVRKEQMP